MFTPFRSPRWRWLLGSHAVLILGMLLLGLLGTGITPGLRWAAVIAALLALGPWLWQLFALRRSVASPIASPLPRRPRQSDARYRAMLEGLPKLAVQGYDRERRVIFWNRASERLYGYRHDEAEGRLLEDLIIPDAMRERVVRDHRAWIDRGEPIPAGRLVLRHKSGAEVAVFSYHVMLGEQGEEPVMFCVDVSLDD